MKANTVFHLSPRSLRRAISAMGLCAMALVPSVRADVEVGAPRLEQTGTKTLVTFGLKNTFSQPIKDVRAWVFLMDADGKVVGNQAEWLIGGGESSPAASSSKPLAPEQSAECVVAVSTSRPAVSAQVTFSRIVLADGSVASPQLQAKAATDLSPTSSSQ